jgi:Icc-related predicted phosphoesterase
MDLLLFSDLHTDAGRAEGLVERSGAFDVLVGAGDFCHCRRLLDDTIARLSAIDTPTVLVPGNSESYEELRDACASWPAAHVLHGTAVTIDGIAFFGIGGGIPTTPFGSWSYDFTEAQAEELLRECPDGCVLVSHSPPHGAVDVSSRGQHLGSTAIRNGVLARRPRLVVCGHIHESAGRLGRLGGVPVINAGPDGVSWSLT